MSRKSNPFRELAVLSRDLASLLRTLEQRGEERLPGSLPRIVPIEIPAAPVPATEGDLVLPPTDLGKEARLDHLRKQAQTCKRCRLAPTRQKVVFGTGNGSARVLFIGEGPGANEDRIGDPFVGKAGALLTRMLQAIGIDRGEVYITNVVKCRPPRNRDPEPDEMAACRAYLDAQLDTIRPDIIVALGRPAAQSLLNDTRPLSQLRSTIHSLGGIDLVVTYHPAFLLRNPARKAAAWADLLLLVDLMVRKGVRKALPDPWWRA